MLYIPSIDPPQLPAGLFLDHLRPFVKASFESLKTVDSQQRLRILEASSDLARLSFIFYYCSFFHSYLFYQFFIASRYFISRLINNFFKQWLHILFEKNFEQVAWIMWQRNRVNERRWVCLIVKLPHYLGVVPLAIPSSGPSLSGLGRCKTVFPFTAK